MKRRVSSTFAALAVLAIATDAGANNDASTTARAGTIAPPTVDGSASDAPAVAINQGKAAYEIPFVLPPGRAGVTPSLSLVYHGRRDEDVVGAGWSLAVPTLVVRTSGRGGQPHWGVAVRYLGLSGEELVELATPLADQDGDGVEEITYREERDASFMRYVQLSLGGWRLDYRDGRKLTLGTDPANRIARVDAPEQIAQWLPETLEDPHGNQQIWIWHSADEVAAAIGTTSASDVSRYLGELRWGCRDCASATTYQSAALGYEDIANNALDFTPGFLVEGEFQLGTVTTATVAGGISTPVRTYDLDYSASDTRRLLTRVAVTGADGSTLPPLTLGYTTRNAGPVSAAVTSPPPALFASGTQPVDVDLDGRTDIIQLGNVGGTVTWYRHQGTSDPSFAAGASVVAKPGASLVAGGAASAEDTNRDLGMDVFDLASGFLYPHDHASGWSAGLFATLPPVAASIDAVRIDVNADGFVDLVDTAANPWVVYLDDGSRTYTADIIFLSPEMTPTVGAPLRGSSAGVLFGEINGDGLVDVVYIDAAGTSASVFYGRGREGFGWLPEDNRALPYSTLTITSSLGTPVRSSSILQDIDGDGLGDLVSFDNAAGRLRVWKRVPGLGFTDVATSSPLTQAITNSSGCRVFDPDNDAVLEVMCSSGWKMYDWADQVPFLLASVDNGQGLITRIGYTTTARVAATHAAAGTAWATNVSMALPIVASTELDDSRGNVLVTAYDYRDARYESDEILENFEFVGFGYNASKATAYLETTPGSSSTRVDDPQDVGVHVRSFYDVGAIDYDQRGMLDCEETWRRSDAPADYTCDVAAQGPLQRRLQTHSKQIDGDGIITTRVDSEDVHLLEGGSPSAGAVLHTEYAYDDFGNRTEERRYGSAAVGDEEMLVNEYVHNTEDWIVSLLRHSRRGDMTQSGNVTTLIQREATCYVLDGVEELCDEGYDGSSDDAVIAGLPTEVLRYTDDDLGDGAAGTLVSVASSTFTANGLPDLETDAAGFVTDSDYDSAFGLFLAAQTRDPGGLGLVTAFQVSTKHGRTTRVTAPDGAITRGQYDDLGRFTKLIREGDTVGSPSLVRSYVSAAPTSTITDVQKDGTSDGLTTIQQVDGAGRLLCSDKEGVGTRDIVAQREYSARGLPTLSILPTQASACETVARAGSGRSSTRNHDVMVYDAMSRLVSTTHRPSGATTTTTYGVLTSTLQDEDDNDPTSAHFETPTDRISDGLGRVTAVIEHGDSNGDGVAETFTTTYAYDAMGVIAVTDPLGTVIYQARRDARSRLVWQDDADRGEETRAYDNADRIATMTDARGAAITTTYDGAGRIATSTADDGVSLDVTTYHYDAHPSGPAQTSACHTLGRLAWVDDASGQTVFCYDALGHTTREDTTIDAYGASALVTKRTFDAMDRLKTLTYPDASKLSYVYDAAGNADQLMVTSGAATFQLVADASYGAGGQLQTLTYGNAVDVTIEYDDRLRPMRHAADASGAPVLDLELGLDGVGNVVSITDILGARSGAFVYDDWSRLAVASGEFVGGETLSYAYDPRGNLLAQQSSDPTWPLRIDALAYADGIAVHALTSVDHEADGVIDESFAYDAVGNLAEDGANGFEFDARGRLAAITDLGGVELASNTYDYAGRRVATRYSANASRYFLRPANAEVAQINGTATWRKFVTFAGHTIGEVAGTFTNANKDKRIVLFAFDHLGAPLVVFDAAAAGTVVERWAGYPSGAENPGVLADEGTLADYRAPNDPASKLSRRFQGREIEVALPDFYDFGARIYRSDLGRFLSADTIVPDPTDSQSWNRYAFARNNPISRIDPSGHADAGAAVQLGNTPRYCTGDNPTGAPTYQTPWSSDLTALSFAEPEGPSFRMPLSPDQIGMSPEERFAYDTATNDAIRGGLGGSVGYLAGGPEGARRGAYADGLLAPLALGAAARGGRGPTPSPTTAVGRPVLPNDALVCRGGACGAASFSSGRGVTEGPGGKLSGVSTQSRAGASLAELARPIKNNQVGVTTAGAVRAAGGSITPDGSTSNPNHATVDGLTAQQLEALFTPTQPNPVPKADRR